MKKFSIFLYAIVFLLGYAVASNALNFTFDEFKEMKFKDDGEEYKLELEVKKDYPIESDRVISLKEFKFEYEKKDDGERKSKWEAKFEIDGKDYKVKGDVSDWELTKDPFPDYDYYEFAGTLRPEEIKEELAGIFDETLTLEGSFEKTNPISGPIVKIFTDGIPVPEPSTMLLLGMGLVGLIGFGRKKFLSKL